MTEFSLSYIISTRNHLPFLKITLEKLISDLQPAEEIVVVDGDSSDGSKEYLTNLFSKRKIHQFISEPDKNQAHAWNKALLMAKGTIIKKIIDDDVFCYKSIRKCKEYMLQNPGIDIIISNDLRSDLSDHANIQKLSRMRYFEKWVNGFSPSFTFGDVHMLIRRSSLAYIGLYNASFVMMDWEYSLRISYLKANICYYTGYNALSVYHPQSVSAQKDDQLLAAEGKRAGFLYDYGGDNTEISLWSKIKIRIGKLIHPPKKNVGIKDISFGEIISIYNYYYGYISECNDLKTSDFINSL